MDYLDELNEVQRKAVMATEGPIMIVAGPGSGKTRVLTFRIVHLMQLGVDPFRILALTFTNKAAAEMRERVSKIMGNEARNLYIGTFHSVFARILRYEAGRLGYPSNFTIYDTDDSRSLLKSIIREQALNDSLYKPAVVHNRISSAKNSLIGPAEYQNDVNIVADDQAAGRPKIGLLYELYAKRCFMAGAMDFDDLLYKMYYLLSQFPDLLYKYQNRFRYIMIDEFQDTNGAQYAIVKKLGDVHQNICVVGDDAQSIYSFRGATIANILNFEKDYSDLQVFKLEQNYRSTKHIVHAANKVIGNNRMQITKEIWTDNHPGEKIKLLKAGSDNDEGKQVIDGIFEEKMRNQRMNKEFVILYRTHSQSRAFEEALRRLNIPYVVYGGISFYQRKEIKDLVAYLRLTVNHFDEESLKRIINYPSRGIGQTTVEKALLKANDTGLRLWEVLERYDEVMPGSRAANAVNDFISKIKTFSLMLQTHNAFDLASHIAKASGLLHELYNDKTIEGLSRYENIQGLLNGIKEFTERTPFEAGKDPIEEEWVTVDGEILNEKNLDKSLGAYLQEITLLTDADKDNGTEDRIKLMTIHSAKGLEFPCVYVVGLEEGLFPNQMSMGSREELEEERRLFYVAITRAQHKLSLTFATTRYRFGNLTHSDPSRFIEEIDPRVIDKQFSHREMNASSHEERFSKVTIPVIKPPQYVHKTTSDFVADDFNQIQTGMEVEHQRFGVGKVVHLEGNSKEKMATIFFQNNVGSKKIMLRYARLRIVKTNMMQEG
ncbi:MAG: UvrD-helicase domain-containing protein [Chitinophagales bacterium]|nr:UvrD-helicase domain-containing protein [Chitinophagales bacterium]